MVKEQMEKTLFRSFENYCRTGYAKLTKYIYVYILKPKQYKTENKNV